MAEYIVDPGGKFSRAIKKATRGVSDLTIPFGLMTKEWYKSNRSIFDLGRKGPGKYVDLSPSTKKLKERMFGRIYPILVASGKLGKSMPEPGNSDSIAIIVNKKTLVLGTKVTGKNNAPYSFFVQLGTRKMPARPFVLLGGEQVAPRRINIRRKIWIKMIEQYVIDVSKGFAE